MFTKKNVVSLFVLFSLLLAACTQAAPTESMADKPAEETMMEDKSGMASDDAMMDDKAGMSDEGMAEDQDAMMDDKDGMSEGEDAMMDDSSKAEDMMVDLPAWFGATLVDVRTGQPFTINDLQGKIILVETLATWCSNCLKQQNQVLALHDLLGERDDFVSVGLSIDPNEEASVLMNYVDERGFYWTYAIAPAEVSNEIARLYGDQFLNPPSTPMLIIDSYGEVHLLPFGIKDAQDLLDALQPFLDGEM